MRRTALQPIPIAPLARSVRIPLLGTVPARKALEPIDHPERVGVPRYLLSDRQNFALRVRGDSMVEDGIRDGDVLVVKRQSGAENGQTVVAVVDGEATVKRFHRVENRLELRPANPLAKSIVLESSAVEIRGVVIGLIRRS
jgi:repressor LexA